MPLLGGVLIAAFGLTGAYLFDLLSFAGAVVCIALMRRTASPQDRAHSPLTDAALGVRFALSRPELIGTYLIDSAAMLFAFPVALFPALSLQWGDARMTGILFASMAIGSLIATLLSGWSSRIRRLREQRSTQPVERRPRLHHCSHRDEFRIAKILGVPIGPRGAALASSHPPSFTTVMSDRACRRAHAL